MNLSKLRNVSAMPRDGFALSDLPSYVFKLFGVARDNAGVTDVSLGSADTLETRTQGGRIAELFGGLRTQDHAVLATPNGLAVGTGVSLGALRRMGGMMRRALVTTTVALAALLLLALVVLFAAPAAAAEEFEKYKLESVSASLFSPQAGAYADFTTSFVESRKRLIDSGDLK